MAEENWKYEGVNVKSRWIPGNKKLEPCSLAVGICFTKDKKLLITRVPYQTWTLPSAKLTKGNHGEILRKFLEDEAGVSVKKIELLGSVEIESDKFPKFYQERYFVIVDEKGVASKGEVVTKFINHSELKEHFIKWGAVGEEVFKEASRMFEAWKK